MTPPPDLDKVIDTHYEGVWSYLRFLGAAPEMADDLTQQVFVAALEGPFEARHPAASAAWLRSRARFLYLNALRASRRKREILAADMEAASAVWDRHLADDDGAAYMDALARCLETLDDRARLAIELRYRDGASRTELARVIDIGDEGAKTLLRRAKERLRTCIEERMS